MTGIGIDDLLGFDLEQASCEESLTAAERCVSGQPLQRTWNLYVSPDERFFAGVWEAEPGCWRINYTEHEYFRILSGRSVIRDAKGNERLLQAGDELLVPAGFEGQWEVQEATRKVYVIYLP